VFKKHPSSGTSNWSQDYYTRTAGIGFVMESVVANSTVRSPAKKDLREKLVDIFQRDWNSPHCRFVEK
jgi:phospholipase D3/4